MSHGQAINDAAVIEKYDRVLYKPMTADRTFKHKKTVYSYKKCDAINVIPDGVEDEHHNYYGYTVFDLTNPKHRVSFLSNYGGDVFAIIALVRIPCTSAGTCVVDLEDRYITNKFRTVGTYNIGPSIFGDIPILNTPVLKKQVISAAFMASQFELFWKMMNLIKDTEIEEKVLYVITSSKISVEHTKELLNLEKDTKLKYKHLFTDMLNRIIISDLVDHIKLFQTTDMKMDITVETVKVIIRNGAIKIATFFTEQKDDGTSTKFLEILGSVNMADIFKRFYLCNTSPAMLDFIVKNVDSKTVDDWISTWSIEDVLVGSLDWYIANIKGSMNFPDLANRYGVVSILTKLSYTYSIDKEQLYSKLRILLSQSSLVTKEHIHSLIMHDINYTKAFRKSSLTLNILRYFKDANLIDERMIQQYAICYLFADSNHMHCWFKSEYPEQIPSDFPTVLDTSEPVCFPQLESDAVSRLITRSILIALFEMFNSRFYCTTRIPRETFGTIIMKWYFTKKASEQTYDTFFELVTTGKTTWLAILSIDDKTFDILSKLIADGKTTWSAVLEKIGTDHIAST